MFELMCIKILGVIPQKEYKFHPSRKWRFDYCFPDKKIAIEIEGGVWTYGRHNRSSGYIKDMEKYNHAAILGYRILRFTPNQINEMQTYEMIKNILK